MSERKAVHVTISGRVQGVGFRAWTKSTARRKGLTGWVRNRKEGGVEAVFSGKAEHVDEMVKACEDGPLASRVKEVAVEAWGKSVTADFEVRETA